MILVTGCNGLLGSFLASLLVEKGYTVKGFIREYADLSLIPSHIRSQIHWAKGSLFNPYDLEHALEGVDTVIHTAAVVSFSPSRIQEMYRVNVEGTAAIVNACLTSKSVRKFVHVSSIAALGRPVGKAVIDENDLWVDSDHNTHYARSKYLAELEVYRGFEEGLDGFVINPSVILSPGDIAKSSTKLFGYVLKGGSYYTEGRLNYVDVRDVCNAVIQLLDIKTIQGERFILNGGVIDYKAFFELVAKEFNVKAPTKKASSFVKELLWRVEYIRSLILGSEPLITKETARLSGVGHKIDNQKIKQLFNYQFNTIEDTIKWVCRELKQTSSVHNLLHQDR